MRQDLYYYYIGCVSQIAHILQFVYTIISTDIEAFYSKTESILSIDN